MADQLGRLEPAMCPLCEQDNEFISHLLTGCDFSPEVWFNVLQARVHGVKSICPVPDEDFCSWLAKAARQQPGLGETQRHTLPRHAPPWVFKIGRADV